MGKKRRTPWYILNSPELGKPFEDFYEACQGEGVLDEKTKELLALVLASAFKSPASTEGHIKRALSAGVTREEITEALLFSAAEAADTQLESMNKIYNRYLRSGEK